MQKACAIFLLLERFAEVAGFGSLGAGGVWDIAAGATEAGAMGVEPDGAHSGAMGLSLVGAGPAGVGLVGARPWMLL